MSSLIIILCDDFCILECSSNKFDDDEPFPPCDALRAANVQPHDLSTPDILIESPLPSPKANDASKWRDSVYAFHRAFLMKNKLPAKKLRSMPMGDRNKILRMEFPAPKKAVRRLELLYADEIFMDSKRVIELYQNASFLFEELLQYLENWFAHYWKKLITQEAFNHSNLTISNLEKLLNVCHNEVSLDRIRIILCWTRNFSELTERRSIQALTRLQAATPKKAKATSKGDLKAAETNSGITIVKKPVASSSLNTPVLTEEEIEDPTDVSLDTFSMLESAEEFPESFQEAVPFALILDLTKMDS
ncbi:hypothetical protein BC829DRAFT_224445 [Chytridium lagenaria]|nr:hypothetical protein BC829DRAFT_224445 [Chytridium lagenaria]